MYSVDDYDDYDNVLGPDDNRPAEICNCRGCISEGFFPSSNLCIYEEREATVYRAQLVRIAPNYSAKERGNARWLTTDARGRVALHFNANDNEILDSALEIWKVV